MEGLTDRVQDVLESGVDVERRRIYWGGPKTDSAEYEGEVGPFGAEFVVRAIDALAHASSEPITLVMSSPGGCPYMGLRIYDHIRACGAPVDFLGSGEVMSAAVVVMCACRQRMLTENATVLVHDGSGQAEGSQEQIHIQVKEFARLDDVYNEIYAANSVLSVDEWAELAKKDVFLTAREAVALGLADGVVEPIAAKRAARKRRPKVADQALRGIRDRLKKIQE